jgi:hypothetical protein
MASTKWNVLISSWNKQDKQSERFVLYITSTCNKLEIITVTQNIPITYYAWDMHMGVKLIQWISYKLLKRGNI